MGIKIFKKNKFIIEIFKNQIQAEISINLLFKISINHRKINQFNNKNK